MAWINRIVALLLIAAMIPLWYLAGTFPGTATTFPRLISVVIGILALIMLARSFITPYAQRNEILGRVGVGALIRPVAVFTATVAGIYLIRYFGFFPAMAGISVAFYFLLGVRRPMMYAFTIVLLLAMVYLIFVVLLDVPLARNGLWRM